MDKLEDHILVIFGASGDLTRRKLLPALYSIHKRGLLTEGTRILGISRSSYTDESYRKRIAESFKEKCDSAFLSRLHYISLDPEEPRDYPTLEKRLLDLWGRDSTKRNALFYLATPPEVSSRIPVLLAEQGLNKARKAPEKIREAGDSHYPKGFRRIILEKPFGRDLLSAKALNRRLLEHWEEDQIYRIDHYLGKETVQNILVFRFANEIFESLWNHRFVEYVEITTAEDIGIENRAGYFDNAGIVRDMIQNHLLQVLAFTALDPPLSFDADSVRHETLKIFKSLRPIEEEDFSSSAVFGQYTTSKIRGVQIPGYREEKGVKPDSRTSTFAALKIFVDNHRWYEVPFYLRTGKRLPTRVSEVVIHFKKTPHPAFGIKARPEELHNHLVIRIQPDEGILLHFGLKNPGSGFRVKPVNMDFHYADLTDTQVSEPYERLLLDSIQGDATLFARADAVEACWSFIDPIVKYQEEMGKVFGYPAGTWGPLEAEELLKQDKRTWRYPCKNLTSTEDYCEL